MFIDAHQHFWQYNPNHYPWISDSMEGLKADFLPNNLKPLLSAIGFDGSIAVQARQTVEETNWLLQLAKENDCIKGVVGWVDLRSPAIDEILDSYATNQKLVGIRHIVQDEPDDLFMLRPDFMRGITALANYHLTYDLLIHPKHLTAAIELVKYFPDQPFVLNHIAKPFISKQVFSPWSEQIMDLAQFENVYCKLSGMVTEANWNNWQQIDFIPYLDIVAQAFGTHRLMIGSDWPVCTLSSTYDETMNIVISYVKQFSEVEQHAILGGNCTSFYQI